MVFSHAHALSGRAEPVFAGFASFGGCGVILFFVISGFLVTQSLVRDPHAGRFLLRRALRIFPGLFACVLLAVFLLGPLLTELPLRQYWQHPTTWDYLATAALNIRFALPGVFTATPVPNAVNGSLWTLPIEFGAYLLLAAVWLPARPPIRLFVVGLLFTGLAVLEWLRPTLMPAAIIFWATDWRFVATFGVYFFAGSLLYLCRRVVPYHPALLAAAAALIALAAYTPWMQIAFWLLVPYAVIGSALLLRSPLLLNVGRYGDFSYGLYIYAFPVQQLTMFWGLRSWPVWQAVLVQTAGTLVFAALSWHLVERPCLRFKPRRPAAGAPVA